MARHLPVRYGPSIKLRFAMQRRCAWCGITIGQTEGGGDVGVTHGICGPCAARVMEEYSLTPHTTDDTLVTTLAADAPGE
jgi:hypothetical protein